MADFKFSAERRRPGADCAKQSQTWETWGMWGKAVIMWDGFAGKWNAQNKANLPPIDRQTLATGAPSLADAKEQLRKTKPISPAVSGEANRLPEKSYGKLDRRTAPKKQSQFPPRRHRAGGGMAASEGYRAKESQFAAD